MTFVWALSVSFIACLLAARSGDYATTTDIPLEGTLYKQTLGTGLGLP